MMYMNSSPFGILKIWKFSCFWLVAFLCKKKCQLSESSVGRDIPRPIYKVLAGLRYTLCAHCWQVFIFFYTKYLPLVCQGLCWHFLPFPFKTEPSLLREFCQQTLFYPKFILYNTEHLKICNAGTEWLEFCLDWQQNRRKSPIIYVDNSLPFYLLFILCYNSQTLLEQLSVWKVSLGPWDTNFVPCKKICCWKIILKIISIRVQKPAL